MSRLNTNSKSNRTHLNVTWTPARFSNLLLCSMPLIRCLMDSGFKWEANNAEHAKDNLLFCRQNSVWWVFLNINAPPPPLNQLSVASFPPVSLGDGSCWTFQNSSGNYSRGSWMEPLSAMNGPLCHFDAELSKPENTSELSHEVRTWDLPWRRADMAEAWACAAHRERWPQVQVGEKTVCSSPDVSSLAAPAMICSRLLAGQTITNELITVQCLHEKCALH